jgi:hypothetical protein
VNFEQAAAVVRGRAEGASSGLVTDSTSGPFVSSKAEPVQVDTRLNRFRRMRYNVIASANMTHADVTRGGFRTDVVFITLTYRTIDQPEPRHISDFLKHCRRHMQRRQQRLRYVWVAELQERGVLHYHVIVWMPKGYKLPKPDNSGWWPYGMSNIKLARAPVGYLAQYAGKLKGKAVDGGMCIPSGFRLYGVGGMDAEDRLKRAWANLPGWLRERVLPQERCKRIAGGGFYSRLLHEFWPSPFKIGRIVKTGGGAFVTLIPAFPEGISLCSPYTFQKS